MTEARILVAEGNDLAASALEQQLHTLGYTIVGIARSGADVVRMCQDLQPDVLLIDMQLPQLSDSWMEQLTMTKSTPVVMITTHADAEGVRQAERAGALAYLVKPVNPEELPPAIDVALARHRELQQLRDHVHELHDTLESHKVVERAKGILMKRLNIGDREAEERIRQRAKEKQVSSKEIAQAIVDSDALLS